MSSTAVIANTEDVIDQCSTNTQEIVREKIGEILQHEGLGALERTRDNALRAITPNEPHPYDFFLSQQQKFLHRCTDLLRRVRPELHRAVDDLIDELEDNVSIIDASRELVTPVVPMQSKPYVNITTAESRDTPSQPRAPVADMDMDPFELPERSRSVTLAAAEHLHPRAFFAPVQPRAQENNADGANRSATPPGSPQNKRTASNTTPKTPTKRAKTANGTPSTGTILPKGGPSSSRTKKSASAKKSHDLDDEYKAPQDGNELPTSREVGRRATREKNPVYEDRPVRSDEFEDPPSHEQ